LFSLLVPLIFLCCKKSLNFFQRAEFLRGWAHFDWQSGVSLWMGQDFLPPVCWEWIFWDSFLWWQDLPSKSEPLPLLLQPESMCLVTHFICLHSFWVLYVIVSFGHGMK
jgi:hypothetical protein